MYRLEQSGDGKYFVSESSIWSLFLIKEYIHVTLNDDGIYTVSGSKAEMEGYNTFGDAIKAISFLKERKRNEKMVTIGIDFT